MFQKYYKGWCTSLWESESLPESLQGPREPDSCAGLPVCDHRPQQPRLPPSETPGSLRLRSLPDSTDAERDVWWLTQLVHKRKKQERNKTQREDNMFHCNALFHVIYYFCIAFKVYGTTNSVVNMTWEGPISDWETYNKFDCMWSQHHSCSTW